jgi:hypothetical protein
MPGRLQAHFAERGIRMTQQRHAILRVMETASKHLDAAQLLRKAQKVGFQRGSQHGVSNAATTQASQEAGRHAITTRTTRSMLL